jgi:hypothetical protein
MFDEWATRNSRSCRMVRYAEEYGTFFRLVCWYIQTTSIPLATRCKAWVCNCVFESRRGHGRLSLVSVVCVVGRRLRDGRIA